MEKEIVKFEEIIMKRDKITEDYCCKKGWDRDKLTFEQILEIRNLKEWKEAIN